MHKLFADRVMTTRGADIWIGHMRDAILENGEMGPGEKVDLVNRINAEMKKYGYQFNFKVESKL